jgi:hypothetical protein
MFRLIVLIAVIVVVGFIWYASDTYVKRNDKPKKKK